MMRQLSPLHIDNTKKVLHNTQEDYCCVLQSQSLESTGSLGVYAIGSLPTEPTIAPEPLSKRETVLLLAKLPTSKSYVPTVHFLLHYFSTFLCHLGFCFTSACLTISGRGRSPYTETLYKNNTEVLQNVK